MVKSLELAIAEVANLPDADQEQIGQRLLSHVEKLRQLRVEVDKGIRSLDAGKGNPLDLEDFLRRKNDRDDRPAGGYLVVGGTLRSFRDLGFCR